MSFLILILLAPVSLGLAVLASGWLHRTRRPWRDARKWPLAVSLVVYCAIFVGVSLDILGDPASTAAVALLVVPTIALGLAVSTLLMLVASTALIVNMRSSWRRQNEGVYLKSRRAECWVSSLLLIGAVALATLAVDRKVDVQRASDPAISHEVLRQKYFRASARRDVWVLVALAKNARTPLDVLISMARAPRSAVAHPPAILGSLRWGRSPLWHLVHREEISTEVLRALAVRGDELVVARVADHPRTPPDVLRQLERHPSVVVLRALANNPNTPPEVLDVLAKYPDRWVRRAVERTRSREYDER